ncbi:biotin synthase BioB, partial [Streptomyces sp. NPDC102270]
LEMIADAGFEVEGASEVTLPEHRVTGGCRESADCGSHESAGCGSHAGGGVCGTAASAAPTVSEPRTDLVAVRRRGAGTDLAPNA